MRTIDFTTNLSRTVHFTVPWVLLAGLTAGTLDLAFASAYWAMHDVPPSRILQVIAGWVIGRETALSGGWTSVLFGGALHYGLMTAMAAGYALASRHIQALREQPLRYGALYGAFLYMLMFFALVPLLTASHSPAKPPRLDWQIACFIAYVVLVGIPCALFARAAKQIDHGAQPKIINRNGPMRGRFYFCEASIGSLSTTCDWRCWRAACVTSVDTL